MAEYRDGKKENMILTLFLWCIICGISMAAMLVTASGKVIVIADAGQEQTGLAAGTAQTIIPSGELLLKEDKGMERQLIIPLEEGIKAENVVMENRYVEQELWIYIQQAHHLFYQENAITGDVAWVEKGWYEVQEECIILKLAMTDVLEYHSTLEKGSLKLALFYPDELYKQIVVIDPSCGGSEYGAVTDSCYEKDLTYQVAKQVQKKITDSNIKVYYTRTEDVQVSTEKRLELVEAVEADMYLRIGVSENKEDSSVFGIQALYNEEYFIPDFGNVQWADMVTRKVTIAASNRAIGLLTAEKDSLLRQLEIPAAQINLGFLTNQQECLLLQQESYQEKLAQGIAEAILEAYTTNNKE